MDYLTLSEENVKFMCVVLTTLTELLALRKLQNNSTFSCLWPLNLSGMNRNGVYKIVVRLHSILEWMIQQTIFFKAKAHDHNSHLHIAVSTTSSGCYDGMFQCSDGHCIYDAWVCDGENDCNGGEDEADNRCKSMCLSLLLPRILSMRIIIAMALIKAWDFRDDRLDRCGGRLLCDILK